MKQLLVLIGCILLGALIFEMMAGDSPDSLKSVSGRAMLKTMEDERYDDDNRVRLGFDDVFAAIYRQSDELYARDGGGVRSEKLQADCRKRAGNQ